ADFVVRLLRRMDAESATRCTPRLTEPITPRPFIDLDAGYVKRALAWLPKQGSRRPWRLYQNYFLDVLMLRLGRLDDGVLEMTSGRVARAEPPPSGVRLAG